MTQKRAPRAGNLVHVTDGLLGVYLGLGIVIDTGTSECTVLIDGMLDIYAMNEIRLVSEKIDGITQQRSTRKRRSASARRW